MDLKKKMLSLKAINILFDTVLVLIVLTVVVYIAVFSFGVVSLDGSIVGYAKIEAPSEFTETSKLFDFSSAGVKGTLLEDDKTVGYVLFPEQHKNVILFWKVLYALTLNLGMLLWFFVLFQIRNIIKNVRQMMKDENLSISNCVFSHKNILRLRYIAYGFMITPFLELIAHCLDGYFLKRFINIEGVNIVPDSTIEAMSWEYILVGLLFIALIEVFRRGIVLQEENDLTV